MLSIYIKKIKNDIKERIYWVVSFQKNVKRNSGEILGHEKSWKVNRKNLLDEHGHFFLWLQLYQVFFVSNLMGKVFNGTILNILKITRAMLMNFCIANTPRCQILIWGAKYFACFSWFLPVKRLFQKMDCIEKLIPTFNPRPRPSLLFGCN